MEIQQLKGAVLLPIFASPPHGVLFIERGHHMRRHAGQIGLPGGTADAIDGGDPARTALRELYEEVGIAADRVTIAGRLPDLEQRMSGFEITPVVGVVEPNTPIVPDGDEVAGTFEVPLAAIVARGALAADALDYNGRHIWGFTARILRSFVDEWNAERSALRRAIVISLRD